MVRYFAKHGVLTPGERRVKNGFRFFTETHIRELEFMQGYARSGIYGGGLSTCVER